MTIHLKKSCRDALSLYKKDSKHSEMQKGNREGLHIHQPAAQFSQSIVINLGSLLLSKTQKNKCLPQGGIIRHCIATAPYYFVVTADHHVTDRQ